MLILQCIIGLYSQSIYFTNSFDQADIPSGEPVFIELPRDSNIDGQQDDVVLILKKILYGQAEAARLWYLVPWVATTATWARARAHGVGCHRQRQI